MKKFYTCKYDRAFKEIMLKKDNIELLKYYLEYILNVEIKQIKINNVELINGNLNTRGKRLDLYLETNAGKINVEMNAENKNYVHPRNLAYICNISQNHTLIGKEYDQNTKIIQINFSYGLNKKKAIYKYEIKNEEDERFVYNFEIYEINMEYFMKTWYNKNQEQIEKYKYFIMLNLEHDELKELSKKDKVVERYMEDLNVINSDPVFIQHMTDEDDREGIYKVLLAEEKEKAILEGIEEGKKTGLEQGIKQGVKEGIKEGIEQGIERGIEQGISQGIKKVAKTMIENNFQIEDIIKITGLTKDEILNLK